MYKGFKVKLYVSKVQRDYFLYLFRTVRFIHNEFLSLLNKYYKNTGKLLDVKIVRDFFTNYLKENKEVEERLPVSSLKNVVNNVYVDFKDFIKGTKGECRYKSKFTSHISLALNHDDFTVKRDRLFLNSYNDCSKWNGGIKFTERGYFPNDKIACNPRLSYDGIDFYLSGSFKVNEEIKENKNKGLYSLGIDVGVKNMCTFSNGVVFSNINNTKRMKYLEEKANFIQHKMDISKLLTDRSRKPLSKNYFKLRRKYLITRRRQMNIRREYLYKIVNEIVILNPKFVCIEDLNVKELVHENSLAKWIFEATFFKFRTILNYKCKWNNIKILVADRYYPSSKMCSKCGFILDSLTLSDRTYNCPKCHCSIDRDLNAAINLANIAKRVAMTPPGLGVDEKWRVKT